MHSGRHFDACLEDGSCTALDDLDLYRSDMGARGRIYGNVSTPESEYLKEQFDGRGLPVLKLTSLSEIYKDSRPCALGTFVSFARSRLRLAGVVVVADPDKGIYWPSKDP